MFDMSSEHGSFTFCIGDIPCFARMACLRQNVRGCLFVYVLPFIDGRAYSLICVAGAGRGPLVARALKAINRANKTAFVYAVEKNPNAYVTYVVEVEQGGFLDA